MTDTDVKALFPKQGEAWKLAQLMAFVHSAEAENTKTAALADNISALGATAVKLLARFV